MNAQTQRKVVDRAGNRCEYCQLSQAGQEATFHIDHVKPRSIGIDDSLENLALACVSCSLRKGAHISGTDRDSGKHVPLFNPRTQNWDDHFQCRGAFTKAGLPMDERPFRP